MMPLALIAVLLGYLLGSIPSAYLIGRFWGRVDLRREGESHVSATAVYRHMGWPAFLVTIVADIVKGLAAVYLAKLFTSSEVLLVATAYAAVVGHCWSVFLRFRGGLGAVITYAVLFALAMWQFLIAGGVAIAIFLLTKKSTLTTYILVVAVSLMLLIERQSLVMVLFPLGLIAIQLLKRFQTRKTGAATGYKNSLSDDFKRIK